MLSGRKLWQFFDESQLPLLYQSHQALLFYQSRQALLFYQSHQALLGYFFTNRPRLCFFTSLLYFFTSRTRRV